MASAPTQLKRDLGVFGATLLGLGSIVGTGVFMGIALATGVIGAGIIVAVILAGVLATCNALSSAQLAAAHPVAGGTYEYGHKYLTPGWGFSAGWLFLCAKSASAGAAAASVVYYAMGAVPGLDPAAAPLLRAGLSAGVALLLMLLILGGIRRTSHVNTAIVGFTLLSLGVLIVLGLLAGSEARPLAAPYATDPLTGQLVHLAPPAPRPFFDAGEGATPLATLLALLQATALMFVAYTGYGRIATMSEEVHDPRRTIPHAIVSTLVVTVLLYAGVAYVGVTVLGPAALAQETAHGPLVRVGEAIAGSWLKLLMMVGAITAMLGVLLNLILGLSRVVLAMGRRGDLPAVFATLNAAGTSPNAAVILMGVVVAAIGGYGDLKLVWSFSAFTVLIYYGLTNLCALRLPPADRLYSRAFAWAGLIGCFGLAWWVIWPVWVSGLAVLGVGHVLRVAYRAGSRGAAPA